jgi:hypothetical protein
MKTLEAKHLLDAVPTQGLRFGHDDAEQYADD